MDRFSTDKLSREIDHLFLKLEEEWQEEFTLRDGDRIAVIGGGPSGSFFTFFALKMAAMLAREINITIFEPKDFTAKGQKGCNYCGGIISELMVQTLAVEGIKLPSTVIQRAADSYILHTEKGRVRIDTPVREKTIATVYRGGGPTGISGYDIESFDRYLFERAMESGAVHVKKTIDRVSFENGRPVLFSGGSRIMDVDLVVGAFGVNSSKAPVFEGCHFRKSSPRIARTAIAEIPLDPALIRKHFGTSVHFFLLPVKKIKFAALIPKRSNITLCILGKDMDNQKISDFLDHPRVRSLFPEGGLNAPGCQCLPMMNVGAPGKPYADRLVMIGDTGSTRLFKDGIGAAYFMGKSAAKTVVMHGIAQRHFREHYMPDYRSLITDNWFGRFLYMFTDLFRDYGLLTLTMLDTVKREQEDKSVKNRILSSVLWDMFTGNERFRTVFKRAISLKLILRMTGSFTAQVFGDRRDGN